MESTNSRILGYKSTSEDAGCPTLNCILLVCAKTSWPDFRTYISTTTLRPSLDQNVLRGLLSAVSVSSLPNVGEPVNSSCCGDSHSLGAPMTNRKRRLQQEHVNKNNKEGKKTTSKQLRITTRKLMTPCSRLC